MSGFSRLELLAFLNKRVWVGLLLKLAAIFASRRAPLGSRLTLFANATIAQVQQHGGHLMSLAYRAFEKLFGRLIMSAKHPEDRDQHSDNSKSTDASPPAAASTAVIDTDKGQTAALPGSAGPAAGAKRESVQVAGSAEAVESPGHSGRRPLRKRLVVLIIAIPLLAAGLYFGVPMVERMLTTVSTDDAYVNGHVTFVAARVPGQVVKVYVDDNNRVHQGDLIVELDKEPYQVQLAIKEALLQTAKAELQAAEAQAHALVGQTRAKRFAMDHAMEDVHNQVALLRAKVAILATYKAKRDRAKADYKRADELQARKSISQQEFDLAQQNYRVGEAQVEEALEAVQQIRTGLGLPPAKDDAKELLKVPPNLDQEFSSVQQALGDLLQTASQLGYFPTTWDATPKKVKEDFYKQDAKGNLDRILKKIISKAPPVIQAQAKLMQAEADLEQAKLNLRYTDVYAEIDGQVTRRNVNPGNNVQAGQNLMAIRSLTEIWIDANFKETQLRELRIGQFVEIEVDMYGSRRTFEGRVTGFEMGTGQTLALLPPQNATGNFVKIVQRLPVRIELTNYKPDEDPLFIGLSVVPYIYINKPATGPDAGKFLQPIMPKRGSRSQVVR
jgi:membrane fusion protein (multidrug efflux system)